MWFLHIQFTDLLGYTDPATFSSVSALHAQRTAYKLSDPHTKLCRHVCTKYIYQALSVTFSPFRTGNNREIEWNDWLTKKSSLAPEFGSNKKIIRYSLLGPAQNGNFNERQRDISLARLRYQICRVYQSVNGRTTNTIFAYPSFSSSSDYSVCLFRPWAVATIHKKALSEF